MSDLPALAASVTLARNTKLRAAVGAAGTAKPAKPAPGAAPRPKPATGKTPLGGTAAGAAGGATLLVRAAAGLWGATCHCPRRRVRPGDPRRARGRGVWAR